MYLITGFTFHQYFSSRLGILYKIQHPAQQLLLPVLDFWRWSVNKRKKHWLSLIIFYWLFKMKKITLHFRIVLYHEWKKNAWVNDFYGVQSSLLLNMILFHCQLKAHDMCNYVSNLHIVNYNLWLAKKKIDIAEGECEWRTHSTRKVPLRNWFLGWYFPCVSRNVMVQGLT